jgi:hypothetical protein
LQGRQARPTCAQAAGSGVRAAAGTAVHTPTHIHRLHVSWRADLVLGEGEADGHLHAPRTHDESHAAVRCCIGQHHGVWRVTAVSRGWGTVTLSCQMSAATSPACMCAGRVRSLCAARLCPRARSTATAASHLREVRVFFAMLASGGDGDVWCVLQMSPDHEVDQQSTVIVLHLPSVSDSKNMRTCRPAQPPHYDSWRRACVLLPACPTNRRRACGFCCGLRAQPLRTWTP